jgi:hypothetical protein
MYRNILAIMTCAAVVTGCAAFLKNDDYQPDFQDPTYESLADDRPSTAPTDVTVLTVFNAADELPEGVELVGGDHLEVQADFPTADDPHVVLGVLRMENKAKAPRNQSQKEMLERMAEVRKQAEERLARAAAKHGANAIFVQHKGRRYAAQALYLSESEPSYAPAKELLAKVEVPAGYRRIAADESTLEKLEPIDVKGQSRTCYAAVFALDEDAKLGRYTRRGLYVSIDTEDPMLGEVRHATPVFGDGRSHVMKLGCTRDAEPVTLSLVSSASKKQPRDLGTGGIVVHVYAKRLSQAEMKKRVDRRAEGWRKTRRNNCQDCFYLRARCGEKDPRNCHRYVQCLAKRGETINSCRELR